MVGGMGMMRVMRRWGYERNDMDVMNASSSRGKGNRLMITSELKDMFIQSTYVLDYDGQVRA